MSIKSASPSALKALEAGPRRCSQTTRMGVAETVVRSARRTFGPKLHSVGLYGSTGNRKDKPYSDIEVWLVLLDSSNLEDEHVFLSRGIKVQATVFSLDKICRRATQLDIAWPVTHAEFASVRRLHGKAGFFRELRRMVFDHPQKDFRDQVGEIIVRDLFEDVGKVRNATQAGSIAGLAARFCRVAESAALLMGLARQQLYTSVSSFIAESLKLKARPDGHDDLCRAALNGSLGDSHHLSELVERYWASLLRWSVKERIDLGTRLRSPF